MQKIIPLVFLTLIFNLAAKADDFEANEEKCYCIAFAGQNDGKRPDKAELPDKSTKDKDCDYWKLVPEGSCLEVGGSLVPGEQPTKTK